MRKTYIDNKYIKIEDGECTVIICSSGSKYWYRTGTDKYHRLDGPAVEQTCGIMQWWVDNKYIDCKSQEEFERLLKLKAFW